MMFDFSKYTNNGGQPSLGNMQQPRQQRNQFGLQQQGMSTQQPQHTMQQSYNRALEQRNTMSPVGQPINAPTQRPIQDTMYSQYLGGGQGSLFDAQRRNRQMRRPNPRHGRLNRPNGRDMYRQRLQQFLMNRPMRRNTMMSRGGLQGMGYRY